MFRINPLAALRHRYSRTLLRAAQRAIVQRGIQLLEMEETFGSAYLLKPRLPIPVVARLHGPHFAVGAALGVPADASLPRAHPPRRYRDSESRRSVGAVARYSRASEVLLRTGIDHRRHHSLSWTGRAYRTPLVAGGVRSVTSSFRRAVRSPQGRRRGDRRVSQDRAALSPASALVCWPGRGLH